jgi:hypothetical protein
MHQNRPRAPRVVVEAVERARRAIWMSSLCALSQGPSLTPEAQVGRRVQWCTREQLEQPISIPGGNSFSAALELGRHSFFQSGYLRAMFIQRPRTSPAAMFPLYRPCPLRRSPLEEAADDRPTSDLCHSETFPIKTGSGRRGTRRHTASGPKPSATLSWVEITLLMNSQNIFDRHLDVIDYPHLPSSR